MSIQEEFQAQLESAEEITEETIAKILAGRKETAAMIDPDQKDTKEAQEILAKMTDETRIREEYPLGDKSLMVAVYPSNRERKNAAKNDERVEVRVTKLLASQLDEFEKNHRNLGKHGGSSIPRYQRKNNAP